MTLREKGAKLHVTDTAASAEDAAKSIVKDNPDAGDRTTEEGECLEARKEANRDAITKEWVESDEYFALTSGGFNGVMNTLMYMRKQKEMSDKKKEEEAEEEESE